MVSEDKYSDQALLQLTDKLHKEYYNSVSLICESARKQAEKIEKLEVTKGPSQYINNCKDFIQEIEAFIKERTERYVPYIQQLSEKSTTNHDCTNCSGGCKLNHDMQLLELRVSCQAVKSMLNRLQMLSLPLYADTMYPDAYRVLRNQMVLIENSLSELFFLENNYLIPKIVEAQNSINAGGK